MFDGIYDQNYYISMKKLIFRKLLKDIFVNFIIISISLSLIVWVIQAVNFLDFISEDGHGFGVYFSYTLLIFPKVFTKLFIIVFFISIFYIILKYENNNELIIFWTLGISKIEFIKNITKFSILMMSILIFFTTYMAPYSQDTARSFIRNSNIDFFSSLIREKKFIDTVSDLTFYINEQNRDKGLMTNIFLKEQKEGSKKFRIIFAKKGQLINKNGKNYFILQEGEIFNNNTNNDFTNIKFENFEFNLSNYTTKTTTIPKIQEINTPNMFRCFLNNGYKKKFVISRTEFICQDGSNKVVIQELLKRLYLPLFLPLVAIVGSLLILQSKAKKSFNKYKFFVFSIGFFIIFASEISIKYATANINAAYLFFLIPIFLYFLIFFIFLKKQNNI